MSITLRWPPRMRSASNDDVVHVRRVAGVPRPCGQVASWAIGPTTPWPGDHRALAAAVRG